MDKPIEKMSFEELVNSMKMVSAQMAKAEAIGEPVGKYRSLFGKLQIRHRRMWNYRWQKAHPRP